MISVFKEAYNVMGDIIHMCTNYGQGSVVKGSAECELCGNGHSQCSKLGALNEKASLKFYPNPALRLEEQSVLKTTKRRPAGKGHFKATAYWL